LLAGDDRIAGLDIGGTKLAVVLSNARGEVLAKRSEPTRAKEGPEAVIAQLLAMLEALLLDEGMWMQGLEGIGIACGGPLNSKTGVIYSPPNLPGWNAVPLKELVENATKLPVIVENDANAGALAELRFGNNPKIRNLVYMTMSTGIGGGIVLDGRIYHGTNDLAGEVGHQVVMPDGPECKCGKRGCLEAICSGPSIARRARQHAAAEDTLMLELAGNDLESITSAHVFAAARAGDSLASRIVDETAYYMGIGIANILQTLNPEVVRIGTIAVRNGDFFLEPLRRYVRQNTWPSIFEVCRIEAASLGESVGDLAAVATFLERQWELTGTD
jgi:glucokinase